MHPLLVTLPMVLWQTPTGSPGWLILAESRQELQPRAGQNTFKIKKPCTLVQRFPALSCLVWPLAWGRTRAVAFPMACLEDLQLIAEAWDAGGLYQVGSFPHWGIWSEWNGQYRDTVRQFIKGTDGVVGLFAQMLCGSPNLYQVSGPLCPGALRVSPPLPGECCAWPCHEPWHLPAHGPRCCPCCRLHLDSPEGSWMLVVVRCGLQEGGRKPYHSINFVTAHDGFTLYDLVAFNNKHNVANGENNNDGENHNLSWNCGEVGGAKRGAC